MPDERICRLRIERRAGRRLPGGGAAPRIGTKMPCRFFIDSLGVAVDAVQPARPAGGQARRFARRSPNRSLACGYRRDAAVLLVELIRFHEDAAEAGEIGGVGLFLILQVGIGEADRLRELDFQRLGLQMPPRRIWRRPLPRKSPSGRRNSCPASISRACVPGAAMGCPLTLSGIGSSMLPGPSIQR